MENDLISRRALLKEILSLTITITGFCEERSVLREVLTEYRKAILRTINETHAVDAVEVVRCKNCKHYEVGVCLKIYSDGDVSPYAWQERKPDDFCSRGKRRADECI